MTRADAGRGNVHIVCAAYNGGRFLPALLDSVIAQTHTAWRLWVRDDGSNDDTLAILRRYAERDARIQIFVDDRGRLGAAGSFAHLMASLPQDATHIMFADQDDVWLPHKIERTLGVMRTVEGDGSIPALVHSDLTVVDAELKTIHPSFWAYAGLQVDATQLKRLTVRNVVTGAAMMINAALRALAAPIPRDAILHDWWYACVASAFGKIVTLRESTILYRQHDANVVGASEWQIDMSNLAGEILGSVRRTSELRQGIQRTAAQAAAFVERYGAKLSDNDREFLVRYAQIPQKRFLQRKVDLWRFRMLPEYGTLRRLGILLRG